MEYINPEVIINIYNSVDDDTKDIIETELRCGGYDIDEILNAYNQEYFIV